MSPQRDVIKGHRVHVVLITSLLSDRRAAGCWVIGLFASAGLMREGPI